MSDNKNKKGFVGWFKGLETEFHKIIWPNKETLIRETTTVTVVAVVLGIIVATLDMLLQYGINFLV